VSDGTFWRDVTLFAAGVLVVYLASGLVTGPGVVLSLVAALVAALAGLVVVAAVRRGVVG
jgi:hypothetical protein